MADSSARTLLERRSFKNALALRAKRLAPNPDAPDAPTVLPREMIEQIATRMTLPVRTRDFYEDPFTFGPIPENMPEPAQGMFTKITDPRLGFHPGKILERKKYPSGSIRDVAHVYVPHLGRYVRTDNVTDRYDPYYQYTSTMGQKFYMKPTIDRDQSEEITLRMPRPKAYRYERPKDYYDSLNSHLEKGVDNRYYPMPK
jgi:hypothetical protein